MVAKVMKRGQWKVVDGRYARSVEHSWLRNHRGMILDVYSVARLPVVQLVYGHIHFHLGIDLFESGLARKDIRSEVVKTCLSNMNPRYPFTRLSARPARKREEHS
jgi:hypothetical protein